MFSYYFEDTEHEKTYIDHERETVRAVLHTQNDTYVFVKIQGNDLFGERNHIETVGGGVEPGEDLVTALHREVMEETGYTVLSEQPLGEITDFYNLIHRKTHSHFYLAEVDTRTGVPTSLTEQEKTLFDGLVELTAEEALKILQNPTNPCSRLIYRRDILAFNAAKSAMQMRCKGLGFLFLAEMLISATLVVLSYMNALQNIPLLLSLVLSEFSILFPSIGYIVFRKLSLRELGFTKIKAGTIAMTILATFCLMPITNFLNILSQFFVPNVLDSLSHSLFGPSATIPGWIILLYMGVCAPFLEELGFRSLFANQFRTLTKPLYAVLGSAFLFGLMHLNLNQFGYACGIGIAMGLINIASGSVYTSIIVHIVFNSSNVLMLMALNAVAGLPGITDSAVSSGVATSTLVALSLFYGVLAVIFFFPLRGCIRWIARHEGHTEDLAAVTVTQKKGTTKSVDFILNIPMIIAIVLGVCLTIL